jgi:hypothetical protein
MAGDGQIPCALFVRAVGDVLGGRGRGNIQTEQYDQIAPGFQAYWNEQFLGGPHVKTSRRPS